MGRITRRCSNASFRTVTLGLLLLAMTVLLTANQATIEAASPNLSVGNASAGVGETVSVPIILSEAPTGLSGFRFNIAVSNPGIATIDAVTIPSFGITDSDITSGSSAMIMAADLSEIVNPGDTNITLASVDITGVAAGSTAISVAIERLDGDDGFGFAATVQAGTFSVINSGPVVTLASSANLAEGQSLAANGSFSDPDSASWSATVDYDDGVGSQPLSLSGNQFSLNHTYSDDGAFSVTVTITDGDGNMGVAVLNATVSNVAPALQLPSNAVVDDSNTYQGSGSFTDPGNDTWSGTIDYGDGSGVQQLALNGKSFSPDHDYADYGIYQVSVTISDDDGAATVGSFSVEIRHICPQHTGLPAPSTDLNGDNKCEDVNGNGRLDFADIVYFFQNLIALISDGHTKDLDFNDNGILDMADIVELFNMMLA